MTIEASKDGVKFSANGDIGNGSVTLRSNQDVEKEENNIEIELTEPVALTFSLKYLVNFCKAQPLSNRVKVCLSNEVPLLVEYGLAGTSYLRFYLAPKVRVSSPSMALPLLVFDLLLTLEFRLVMRSKDDGDNRYFDKMTLFTRDTTKMGSGQDAFEFATLEQDIRV